MPAADSVLLLAHSARNMRIQNLVGAEDDKIQLALAVVLDRLFPHLELERDRGAAGLRGEPQPVPGELAERLVAAVRDPGRAQALPWWFRVECRTLFTRMSSIILTYLVLTTRPLYIISVNQTWLVLQATGHGDGFYSGASTARILYTYL